MVNFVDTCVLTNLLNIPGFNQNREEVNMAYQEKNEAKDSFVIPLAVLVETGNHIAQIKNNKYDIAKKFSELILGAIEKRNNFTVVPEITSEQIMQIMQIMRDFPENAVYKNCGFGDQSILSQFEDYWANKQPIGEMCIWSLDSHLNGIKREGGLKRRKDK